MVRWTGLWTVVGYLALVGCGTQPASPERTAAAPKAESGKVTVHVPDMARRLDLG
jgi:hypothetical protein